MKRVGGLATVVRPALAAAAPIEQGERRNEEEEDGKEQGGGGFIYIRGGARLVLLKLEGSLMICSPNLP